MLLVVPCFPGSSHSDRLLETASLPTLGFQSLVVASYAVVHPGVHRRFSIHTPTDHTMNPWCIWARRLFLLLSRIRLSTCTSPPRISTSLHHRRNTDSDIESFRSGCFHTVFEDDSLFLPHLLSRPPASPTDVRLELSGPFA